MQEKKTLAPIALFVYNRPEHTQKTIESLLQNKEAKDSKLYIYSDGAKDKKSQKNVELVRNYIDNLSGFEEIIIKKRELNLGLAKSIISGVSEVIEKYERIIVLEDDMVCSENFLNYMNEALYFYEKDEKIFSIAGYTPKVKIPENYLHNIYLFNRISSWGWASWKNRWRNIDWEVRNFDQFIIDKEAQKKFNQGGEDCTAMLLNQMTGKINSWAIRFNYACFLKNMLNVYPVKSKIINIGADGSGTHVNKTERYSTDLDQDNSPAIFINLTEENEKISNEFRRVYKKSIYRKIINYLKIRCYKKRT